MPEKEARTPVPEYVRTPAAGFLNSLAVDRALVRYDLAGSVAHVEMLGRVGILTSAETQSLLRGLRQVAREVASGQFPWRPELEDVHTNVEVRLSEIVGSAGGKLHTGRSRNDQVALDERLYLRCAIRDIASQLLGLQSTLLARAEETRTTPMPGYTHLQRAQPITLGHWLLAHFWRFDRDVDRLLATARRSDVSPLGAGAIAGSTLPIDPSLVATRLGFERAFENSIDAVSDRDSLAELLFDLALLAVHASALGEDVVVFATKEFGFIERTPALGSGSSLMPQKRNPDVAELARGKAGRAIGDLVALLTLLKGLPLAYDRDLQEDKAPVFDAVGTTTAVLDALSSLVAELKFDHDRLWKAAQDPEIAATDRAERMVARGVPFREAHGSISRTYSGTGPPTAAPAAATVAEPAPVDPSAMVELRASPGGPAPSIFEVQSGQAHTRLDAHRASLSSLDQKVELIEELLTEEKK
jgi:argininosuccinate lyase